jgi:hypothetical protein
MASISSVDPNILAQGDTSKTIRIIGAGTHFDPVDSSVTFSEPLITITATNYSSPEWIEVVVNVGAGAVAGPVTVQVSTAGIGEVVIAIGAITIVADTTPRIVSIDPTFGIQGQTLNVTIEGANTTFVQDVARAVFSSGGVPASSITVNSTTVGSHTTCIANVTIGDALHPPEAVVGFYDVSVLNT